LSGSSTSPADPSKQALRQAILAVRRAMPAAERTRRSELIARRFLAEPWFASARTIAVYAAMGAEVDPSSIEQVASEGGKRVAFPVVLPGTRTLGYATCTAAQLVGGPHGTREPPPGCELLPLTELDLVLVPGVAFDLQCHRLGRGGGHYDATLASLPAPTFRVGLAFEAQLVAEVPVAGHDATVDAVVTEERILRRPPEAGERGSSSR
jgi:5-formyltetrahydrofolate cyclo-ligase